MSAHMDICLSGKSKCSGCEACANVCPRGAIEMRPDWRGFLFPHINSSKCVGCKLCVDICPANKKSVRPFTFRSAAAYIDGNVDYLLRASSGGAFGAMARFVIAKGGVVFGCCMDECYNIFFTSVNDIDDLCLLHGSKYAQAHVGLIYRKIRDVLQVGKLALVCACPCQIAGLKSFLRRGYNNLITMDLICHGVPSQEYFKEYVRDILKTKRQEGVKEFRFRYKSCDANVHEVYDGFHSVDYYMTYFLWGKGYRESCYNCRFAGAERVGDFTIGDFWNNNNLSPKLDDSKGVSLIFFNTPKAESLKSVFKKNSTFVDLSSLREAMGTDEGQMAHPSKDDLRTRLIYVFWRLFGVWGPRTLFLLDRLRMRH